MSDKIIIDSPPPPSQTKKKILLEPFNSVKASYGAEQAPAGEVLGVYLENRKAWRGSQFEDLLDEAAGTMSERRANQWIREHPESTLEEVGAEMGTIAMRFSLGLEYGAVKTTAYPNWHAVEKEVLEATKNRREEDQIAETRVTEGMPNILEAYGFARLLTGDVDEAMEALTECAKRRNVSLVDVTKPNLPLLAKVGKMAEEGGPLYHFYKDYGKGNKLFSLVHPK